MKAVRPMVQVVAVWGNDDVESTIRLRPSLWRSIYDGRPHERRAWAWYEGKRFPVIWRFGEGKVSIHGPDASDCVVDLPVNELMTATSD